MKRLHTNSKIPFSDPYMVRVEYPPEISMDKAMDEYRKLTRLAYRLLQGTWGHCPLDFELIKVKDDYGHTAPPGPGHYTGLSPHVVISTLFDPDFQNRIRGYICFKDELDALQFRLSIDTTSRQVHMWPSNKRFTIHEVVENES